MPVRYLDPSKFGDPLSVADANADWHGNNAAFTCPVCSKVFIVSHFNKEGENGRPCPGCGKSKAFVTGSPSYSGHQARIEWE